MFLSEIIVYVPFKWLVPWSFAVISPFMRKLTTFLDQL